MTAKDTNDSLKERYEKAVYLRGKAEETYMHAVKNYEGSYAILKEALNNLFEISKLERELRDQME